MFDYVFYLTENKKGNIEIEEPNMLELACDYEICLVQFKKCVATKLRRSAFTIEFCVLVGIFVFL